MPVCYDAQRRCILLRREGWMDNHQRVHCLYRSKGLYLHILRPKRKLAAAHPLARLPMGRPQQLWRRDFVCCKKAYSLTESSCCLKVA
jgi:putative transposase